MEGREGGRSREREGGRERGREDGREEDKGITENNHLIHNMFIYRIEKKTVRQSQVL